MINNIISGIKQTFHYRPIDFKAGASVYELILFTSAVSCNNARNGCVEV